MSHSLKTVDDVILHVVKRGGAISRAQLIWTVLGVCTDRNIDFATLRNRSQRRTIEVHIDAALARGSIKELTLRLDATRLHTWYVLKTAQVEWFGADAAKYKRTWYIVRRSKEPIAQLDSEFRILSEFVRQEHAEDGCQLLNDLETNPVVQYAVMERARDCL